jgi:hypothetical protein
LQTLMIYKWVNSIITLNSQVAEWYPLLMWEDPSNVLKPHYRFESCPDYLNLLS